MTATLTVKLSVVVVPNEFVNVIVDDILSPLCVVEPLKSNANDNCPFEPLIAIAGLDEVNVPLWFEP